MSHFTPQEIAYLRSQPVGRLATVNERGEPHVAPVGFIYNPTLDTIDIGGRRGGFGSSKKFRDALRTGKAALVVDDVVETHGKRGHAPQRQIRGIEVRGTAEAHETGGDSLGAGYDPAYIRIHPTRIISWGINTSEYAPDSRNVHVEAPGG